MAAPGKPSAVRPNSRLAAVRRGLLFGVLGLLMMGGPPALLDAGFVHAQADARPALAADAPPHVAQVGQAAQTWPVADFGASRPSADARHVADWIARAQDNQGQAFFLIDKIGATLYAFDRDARLQASTPVLLGAAPGDDSVPGIGTRPMAQILPSERTTPAGRFVAEGGRNLNGEDIVWVDYGAAVSMHRVRTTNPLERRAERLATPTVDDNRISYGCINVPVAFYNRHVQPVFSDRRTAIVYVLPQTRSLQEQPGLTWVPARVPERSH